MTSCFNTPALLYNDGLCFSTSDLATLNDLSVSDLSHIDTTSIQELCQALEQLVVLAQYLLGSPRLKATVMVVDYDHLRQQCDQERTAQLMAHNLVTQRKVKILQLHTRN
jgi:hypothetical protein